MDTGEWPYNEYRVANLGTLRALLRSLSALEGLAAGGDMGSAAILLDLRSALGDGKTDRVLVVTPRQREAITFYLIEQHAADDVAQRMRVARRMVYLHVERGLRHILRYLQTKETNTWLGQPWKKQYVQRNPQLTRKELAQHLATSVKNIEKMRTQIYREQRRAAEARNTADTRGVTSTGGCIVGGGPQTTRLDASETGRIPTAYTGTVTESVRA